MEILKEIWVGMVGNSSSHPLAADFMRHWFGRSPGEICMAKSTITHCPAEFRNLAQSSAGEIRLKLLPP
jgi:hypothetical protein